MRAPLLSKNGMIGICSPSHIAKYDEYQIIIESILNKGYRVREADNLYKSTDGYHATPKERADDLNQLVADPEVELIFFGGGEGSNELLPYIDYEQIRKHPKRFCSYSDGTTILDSIYAITGLETYYGQAPSVFNHMTDYDEKQFLQHIVEGKDCNYTANSKWQVQTLGKGEGILIGGYARNFALLLGNRYFPLNLNEKYLLFIEDHEKFGGIDYVSAMLSHIEQHDFINSVTGFIFGHYSENPHPELLCRLKRFGERYHIPVVYCDDFGHGVNRAILPIGRKAILNTEEATLLFYK